MCLKSAGASSFLRAPKADEPAVAAEFLRKFNVAKHPPHRVSVHFVGHGHGTLREDMAAHAAGNGMSSRLRAAILSYQLCILDDSVSERPHREVSHRASHAPNSKLQWWSSSVRLDQNLNVEASVSGHASVHSFWPVWKVLGQRNNVLYAKGTPGRVCTKLFLSRIYRTGAVALADWGALASLVPSTAVATIGKASGKQLLAARNLQSEYIRSILRSDKVYTLPLDVADICDASMLSNAKADVVGLVSEQAAKAFLGFQIIDLDVAKTNIRCQSGGWR